jgi:hypothetical protein
VVVELTGSTLEPIISTSPIIASLMGRIASSYFINPSLAFIEMVASLAFMAFTYIMSMGIS